MRLIIFEFMWKHLLKILSTAFVGFFYILWSFIQMPYKAAADIVTLQETNSRIYKELIEMKVVDGVNTRLLVKVDSKLDAIQEAVIKYSTQERVGHPR